MPFFQYGAVIRRYREELGITQEELSEGICSVPTLSRIENGERMPSKDNLTMLLQKLGKTDMFMEYFVDENDFELHELKYRIRQAQINQDINLARDLLKQYRHHRKDNSITNRQFELLHEILLYPENYTTEDKLVKLEHLIRQTSPSYTKENIPALLTYEEILLLNNIARCYDLLGDSEASVHIFSSLLSFYERKIVNSEEVLRTKPLILYNLANQLCGLERYDECIARCDEGIALAQHTGRCAVLPYVLYVRAWALLLRNKPEDKAEAEKTMNQAVQLARVLNNHFVIENGTKTLAEKFNVSLPDFESLKLEWQEYKEESVK